MKCPTCGPTKPERHPRRPAVTRCANCKEWLVAPCGSCGEPGPYVITLHGGPTPACLRHLNHWRTPAADYTCPTACVETSHPGREHHDWLATPAPEADQ